VQQVTVQQWAAVVPPPAALQGFETVLPGSADRILVMAEEEGSHRRRMDLLFAVYRFLALGVGAVIAVGGLLLCAYLIKRGQTGWAVGAFLAEITALAALFVVGRYYRVGAPRQNGS
jgi:uncharacterized membrane protein